MFLPLLGSCEELFRIQGRTGETRFLYGGSAGPGMWTQLKGGLDGLLLGRYAHDLEKLEQVVEEVEASGESADGRMNLEGFMPYTWI